jgi:hypothetical protein
VVVVTAEIGAVLEPAVEAVIMEVVQVIRHQAMTAETAAKALVVAMVIKAVGQLAAGHQAQAAQETAMEEHGRQR